MLFRLECSLKVGMPRQLPTSWVCVHSPVSFFASKSSGADYDVRLMKQSLMACSTRNTSMSLAFHFLFCRTRETPRHDHRRRQKHGLKRSKNVRRNLQSVGQTLFESIARINENSCSIWRRLSRCV